MNGPPTAVEDEDGEPMVVDQDGYELVIRRKKNVSQRRFHLPHPETAAAGEQRALCRQARSATNAGIASEWIWRRRSVLEGVWSLCEYCASDDPDNIGAAGGSEGPNLATKLAGNQETKAAVEEALANRSGGQS